jgi:hypothetical protein
VDHEKDICPECGHPLDCSKGKGKLIKCRKCGNQTSTEAKCCPKCSCPDPIIEPLPFVKCRENDCGSIIHKEAKHCPNCGCPDPAPRGASTLKSDDYANADFLVKRKGEKPGRFTTNEIIDKIKIGQILPQQKITIDGPDEHQLWRPAYYYLPFSDYEDFDAAENAAAKKAAVKKAAAVKAAAKKAAGGGFLGEEKAEKKLRRKLLYACTPALFLNGSASLILLVKLTLSDSTKQLLGIDHSNIPIALLCGAVVFGLALGVALFDPWRSRVAAFMLSAWYYIILIFICINSYNWDFVYKFAVIFHIIIILGPLAYTFGINRQLERIKEGKIGEEAEKRYRE